VDKVGRYIHYYELCVPDTAYKGVINSLIFTNTSCYILTNDIKYWRRVLWRSSGKSSGGLSPTQFDYC